MDKEFIPYEQALALKELEFNKRTFAEYSTIQNNKWVLTFDLSGEGQYPNSSSACIAPTFSQAFRWFREKYPLHTVINIGIPHDNITHSKKIQYFFNVVKCGKHHKGIFRSTFYTTYEEAELECLKKLIEIVKQK
jgi:hypothetical protein